MSTRYVLTGESIAPEVGSLRGHGTRPKDGDLVATVSGVVQRVNKLVMVKSVKGRFYGEIGDVVVGQIVGVQHGKRFWNVDVGSRHDSVLHLSAIILPGAVQRKRTIEDSLNMRQLFLEGDYLSAEVQNVRQDGVLVLRTRSLRYGKLSNGIVVRAHPSLIPRQRSHFVRLKCGVDTILGLNGYIWLREKDPSMDVGENEFSMYWTEQNDEQRKEALSSKECGPEARMRIARVRNSILVLNSLYLPITPESIGAIYDESIARNILVKDILTDENILHFLTSKVSKLVSGSFGRGGGTARSEDGMSEDDDDGLQMR